jgi:hypothetical protein
LRSQPAAIKQERGDLMSNNYGLTPEQVLLRRKRKKHFLYIMFFALTIALSAIVTIAVNSI